MHVAVARVVPHALGLELQCVQMGGGLIVRLCMRLAVSSTANVAANEAYPQISRDEQEEHEDWLGAVGFANGIVRADVDVVGWEDIKF